MTQDNTQSSVPVHDKKVGGGMMSPMRALSVRTGTFRSVSEFSTWLQSDRAFENMFIKGGNVLLCRSRSPSGGGFHGTLLFLDLFAAMLVVLGLAGSCASKNFGIQVCRLVSANGCFF